jgi:hypothetical protein
MEFKFIDSRNQNKWKIIETGRYIFHIEYSMDIGEDLKSIIENADKKYDNITNILEIDYNSKKSKERHQKNNFWIHNGRLAKESGLWTPQFKSQFEGTVNTSGVNVVAYNMSWKECESQIIHEVSHLIWINEVGAAPSIWNEGIAVYVENLLCNGQDVSKEKYIKLWKDNIDNDKLLKKLTDNRYFFTDDSKVPIHYNLGGILVGYIIKKWGINILKEIFLDTFYDDEKLAEVIENKTKQSVDDIQKEITGYLI